MHCGLSGYELATFTEAGVKAGLWCLLVVSRQLNNCSQVNLPILAAVYIGLIYHLLQPKLLHTVKSWHVLRKIYAKKYRTFSVFPHILCLKPNVLTFNEHSSFSLWPITGENWVPPRCIISLRVTWLVHISCDLLELWLRLVCFTGRFPFPALGL